MKTNLPTKPGPYWWRANDECDWDPVYVREDSTVPGYEYTVLFPETGVEIDLPDLRGQWAKAHKPDEGIEAWAVKNRNGKLDVCWFDEQHTSLFVDQINEIPPGGNKVVPVTIYKREVGA